MAAPSESFVAAISKTLQSADVPCVLWGHCLLNTHGVPSIVAVSRPRLKHLFDGIANFCQSIDFIVPDRQLQAAVEAISTSGRLEPCREIKYCPAGPHDRYTPPPAHHMHVDGSDITVGLYPQSDTLWFLPELDQALVHPPSLKMHPHFVFASDGDTLPPERDGRGAGAFKNDEASVLVPRAIVLLEAFLRLYARDCEKQIGSFAMQMITYIEEYVDGDGYLDHCTLPTPLQTLYEELKGGEKPVHQWKRELRSALGVQDEQDQRQRPEVVLLNGPLRSSSL